MKKLLPERPSFSAKASGRTKNDGPCTLLRAYSGSSNRTIAFGTFIFLVCVRVLLVGAVILLIAFGVISLDELVEVKNLMREFLCLHKELPCLP